MTPMALWQRVIYNLGEALLVGGLLWGLYRVFILRACPVGPFNDLTLIVVGLAVSVLPLHPFRVSAAMPGYLVPALRRLPTVALAVWLIAVAGVGFSLWSRLTLQPGNWWFAGVVPSALYFWFGITTRINEPLKGPVLQAAVPADKKGVQPEPAAPPDKKEPPDA